MSRPPKRRARRIIHGEAALRGFFADCPSEASPCISREDDRLRLMEDQAVPCGVGWCVGRAVLRSPMKSRAESGFGVSSDFPWLDVVR